ncbi:hypothetical protein V6N13_048047 [Hibiscus sabdariffa]
MSILNILLIFTSRQFSNHSIYSADKILWVGSSTLCRGVDTDEFSLSISGLQVISSATIDAKYDMRKKSLLPQTANYNRFSWIWKTIASSFINAHEGLFSNNIRVRLDCSLVVDWILDGNHIPNIFFKDIDKVRQMGQTFPFKFQAIDREADDAADKLAREAIDRAYPFIWMDVSSSNVGFGSNLCTSSHGR